MLCAPFLGNTQIGIGTTTPNAKSLLELSSTSKGFLLPRMTGAQKTQMALSSNEAGMIVYQTDGATKGLHYFDGTSWTASLPNGTVAGQAIRWDGSKWAVVSNFFNSGSSIGIGTSGPQNQLHIHSPGGANTTRLQLTSLSTGTAATDGFLVGVTQSNSDAHLLQNEEKPLWFGTAGIERMRIDSAGNLGIGTTQPEATLDVNGTVRIGATGTILHSILKETFEVEIDPMAYGAEGIVDIEFPNTLADASVYVSPSTAMSGMMIAYARVKTPGTVEVKFMCMNPDMVNPMTVTLHVSVIQ